eukprot:scaffold101552_cov63-Phaeocystis_antarctica.AAC.4
MATLHVGLHRLLALPMRGLHVGSAGLGGAGPGGAGLGGAAQGEPGLLLVGSRPRWPGAAVGIPSCRGGALGCVRARCAFLRGCQEGPRGTRCSGRPGRGS